MKNAQKITPWHDEEHIVSVVVHLKPEFVAAVDPALKQLSGIEFVAEDSAGKIVLLISAPSAAQVMQQIEIIQQLEGVLSTAMIAHHSESCEALNEEIDLSDLLLSQSESVLRNQP
ncbi:MAG: chaperone NapD [Reinekea sp.]